MIRHVFAVILVLAATVGRAAAATVYDNTITYTNRENVLLPAGQVESGEHGNTITLAGTERTVTGITIKLRIGGAGVAQFDLKLRFYQNDGPASTPGTLLWESPLFHRVIDSGAPLTYSFTVPNIQVPDSFTFTEQVFNRQLNMAAMGPSEFNPPGIGSAPFGFWRRLTADTWEFVGLDEPPFGAKVLAEATAGLSLDAPEVDPLALRVEPNPVVDRVRFSWESGSPERPCVLDVFDPQGRVLARFRAGAPSLVWSLDPSTPRGVYFARLTKEGVSTTTKFVVLQ